MGIYFVNINVAYVLSLQQQHSMLGHVKAAKAMMVPNNISKLYWLWYIDIFRITLLAIVYATSGCGLTSGLQQAVIRV